MTEKRLDFIQQIITRMANNSFLLKGWSLTVSTAIVGLSSKSEGIAGDYFMLLPVVLFWYLDSYYLSQERAFRKLYQKAITAEQITNSDYSLDNREFLNGVCSIILSAKSRTVLPFYLAQILFIYFGFIS
ncbi:MULTISPECIES: hypothetical protein [unclassified Pseudoalteromonas]|uniref:hypothetical protein n=1 Tax=unclassified Pseudoalteromonas TaxID=194690 RepID=UPI0013FD739B|nr:MULTISPECIES: hypothetical protein [unclassified Pseudoalteromonas]MBG9992134.1 hypothetical protein [Pseudoalteromonas sp. NZS37]